MEEFIQKNLKWTFEYQCGKIINYEMTERMMYMNLPNDPIMLFGVINLKLRDFYSNLDALCEDLDVNKEELVNKLKAAGFEYNEERNCFE